MIQWLFSHRRVEIRTAVNNSNTQKWFHLIMFVPIFSFLPGKKFTWSLAYKVGWCCRRWKRKLLVFDCGAGTCLWHFRQIGVSSFWSVFFVNPKYAHTLDENAFCGGYSLVGDGVSVSSNSDDIARVCHVM